MARTNTTRKPRTRSRSPATGGAETPHTQPHDTQIKDRDAKLGKLGGGHIPALFSPLVSVARTYSHTARLPPCCRIHAHLTLGYYKQAGFSSGNQAHRNKLHKPHMLRFQPRKYADSTGHKSLLFKLIVEPLNSSNHTSTELCFFTDTRYTASHADHTSSSRRRNQRNFAATLPCARFLGCAALRAILRVKMAAPTGLALTSSALRVNVGALKTFLHRCCPKRNSFVLRAVGICAESSPNDRGEISL